MGFWPSLNFYNSAAKRHISKKKIKILLVVLLKSFTQWKIRSSHKAQPVKIMHLSMLSPREGGVGHGVGILAFSFKIIQIPHPWDKMIGHYVHTGASEGGKMSFV